MGSLRMTLAAFLVLGVMTMACSQEPQHEGAEGERIELPPPQTEGEIAVEAAIEARRSVRQFTDQALTIEQIGQIAWAAQGITDQARGLRASPSAGATYPLEIYLVTAEGVGRYLPEQHALEMVAGDDRREALAQAALGQGCVAQAPLVVAVAGVYERTAGRYGPRAERYVHMEVGHLGQNVHLQAVALGLGSVPVGAFDDDAVADVLDLPPDHAPLYLVPVGHPR